MPCRAPRRFVRMRRVGTARPTLTCHAWPELARPELARPELARPEPAGPELVERVERAERVEWAVGLLQPPTPTFVIPLHDVS